MAKQSDSEGRPQVLRFEMIKSPQYRTVHADGVFGGLTPSGKVHLAVYNERFAVPTALENEVLPDGSLGTETKREGRQAIVREMDVGIVMSIEAAKALRDWLDDKVKQMDVLDSNP